MAEISRLRTFVAEMTRLADQHSGNEDAMIDGAEPLLRRLVGHDDWLPPDFARPDPERYQQFLLHCDPLERFSVVSFVWGPGQTTPIHDHMVWGLVGMLRGAEYGQRYERDPGTGRLSPGARETLQPGDVDIVSPTRGDIHTVANALQDQASISIHVYGANIGAVRRHVFGADTGEPKPFISGYSADIVPNLWDRSG